MFRNIALLTHFLRQRFFFNLLKLASVRPHATIFYKFLSDTAFKPPPLGYYSLYRYISPDVSNIPINTWQYIIDGYILFNLPSLVKRTRLTAGPTPILNGCTLAGFPEHSILVPYPYPSGRCKLWTQWDAGFQGARCALILKIRVSQGRIPPRSHFAFHNK